MDIYVVLDEGRFVDVSAKLQGAELIRLDEAKRQAADAKWLLSAADLAAYERSIYDGLTIENRELKDTD